MEFLKDEDIKESEKFVCKEVGLMYMAAKAIRRPGLGRGRRRRRW